MHLVTKPWKNIGLNIKRKFDDRLGSRSHLVTKRSNSHRINKGVFWEKVKNKGVERASSKYSDVRGTERFLELVITRALNKKGHLVIL